MLGVLPGGHVTDVVAQPGGGPRGAALEVGALEDESGHEAPILKSLNRKMDGLSRPFPIFFMIRFFVLSRSVARKRLGGPGYL